MDELMACMTLCRASSAEQTAVRGILMTQEGDSLEDGEAEEQRQEGHVKANVWAAYAASMGWSFTILIAASMFLMQVRLSPVSLLKVTGSS